jgi:hypothetical protein
MRSSFSRRTAWDRTPNPLTLRLADARARGAKLTDLTESNPTRAGIVQDELARALVSELGHARGVAYAPEPLGHATAREAVAGYYAARAVSTDASDATGPIDASRIVLSASSSEAYAWLFKLLCERGDRVLVPSPSYPLFEWLAGLEEVELAPYPLAREEGFRVDVDAVARALEGRGPADRERTRAILLVHPNNPTGSFVRRDDAAALEALAAANGLALVVDEVFGDYAHAKLPDTRLPSFAGRANALTFVLGGLSKVVAMPQLKLGWTVVSGPPALADEALARLEMIADTYLSVATPVQLALPALLEARPAVQRAILDRVRGNLAALDATLARVGAGLVRRLPVEGGWYAILDVPRTRAEDEWVERLVELGVVVHPGYFFDLDREGYLVVSLLPRAEDFAPAIDTVVRAIVEG